jgi:TonB family protein
MILFLALAAAGLVPEGGRAHFRPPAHRARANLAALVSDEDYPAGAIRSGEQGIVAFELDVDPAGRVGGCRITGSSGSSLLDEATCRIMRERAQFTPARDRRGRAVPDRVAERLHWFLPEEASAPPLANLASYISDADYPVEAIRNEEQGTVGFQLDIGADGMVSGCRIVQPSGSASLDEATCRIMRARARFSPARDDSGNPVPDRLTARVRWVLPADTDLTPYITSADYPAEALRQRQQGRIEVKLTIAPNGGVASCRVTQSSGSAALDARTCEIVRERAQSMPWHGDNGSGVANVLTAEIRWTLPAR